MRALKKTIGEAPQINKAFKILKNLADGSQEDKCGKFADFMAEELRKLNPHVQVVLQHKMHELILQAKPFSNEK